MTFSEAYLTYFSTPGSDVWILRGFCLHFLKCINSNDLQTLARQDFFAKKSQLHSFQLKVRKHPLQFSNLERDFLHENKARYSQYGWKQERRKQIYKTKRPVGEADKGTTFLYSLCRSPSPAESPRSGAIYHGPTR